MDEDLNSRNDGSNTDLSEPAFRVIAGDAANDARDTHLRHTYLTLSDEVREASVDDLNQMLIDTVMLRDLYKKHHWQSSGPTFQQLHLLYDAHYAAQAELADLLAERVQTLGGTAIAMPNDVAELTLIDHPPTEGEAPRVQIKRLLSAHKVVLGFAHEAAAKASELGDLASEDLVVSSLIATNEKQSWVLAEHLV